MSEEIFINKKNTNIESKKIIITDKQYNDFLNDELIVPEKFMSCGRHTIPIICGIIRKLQEKVENLEEEINNLKFKNE